MTIYIYIHVYIYIYIYIYIYRERERERVQIPHGLGPALQLLVRYQKRSRATRIGILSSPLFRGPLVISLHVLV